MRDRVISSDLQRVSLSNLEFMQYDNGSTITVQLYDDGESVNLSGANVVAKFERADGEIYDRATIISGNTAKVTLDSTLTAVIGTLKIIFKIVKDGKQVHTFMIEAEIVKGIGEGNSGDIGGNTGNTTLSVDLSDYYVRSEVDGKLATKVDKVVGKGLSTNDFTNEHKVKVENIDTQISDLVANGLGQIANGTPLPASSVAEMTDTTRIYVNTVDGHWYWYNGANWQNGGVYQATQDSETVVQLGEEVTQLKNDISEISATKIKGTNISSFKHNSETISSVEYNNQNDFVWTFCRQKGYIGSFVRIDDSANFINKKYKIYIYNPNKEPISIKIYITKTGGRWTIPDYAYEVGDVNDISYDEIRSIEIEGSDYSNITEPTNSAYFTFSVTSINDLNKESTICFSIYEIINENKLGNAINAKYAINSLNAKYAEISLNTISAKNAINAKYAVNAGYETIDDSLIITNVQNNPNAYWERNNNEYTVHISQPDSSVINKINHTFSIDIKKMFGKGIKIKFDIHNSNYNGNLSTSWVFNHFYISQNAYNWGASIKSLNNIGIDVGAVDSTFTIDLDSLEIEYENYNTIYMIFGAYTNHLYVADYNPPTTITVKPYLLCSENKVIATDVVGFEPNEYYKKSEIDGMLQQSGKYITTWGDSLTAGGGWNTRLAELAGMPLYNGGTGGENSATIVARQGADVMMVNNITIPSTTTPVTIATRNIDEGITTYEGKKVTPLLQGGTHVNPCKIGDVIGTLKWTGTNYAGMSGTWTFTRKEIGEEVIINRPTAIRTDFDMNKNAPYLAVIFIGQNGGYDNNLDILIRQHRLMIEHSNAKHTIILGLSSGSKTQRAEYEERMKNEFGRYFISLREYLSTPIYDENNNIISCYGLDDQGLGIDTNFTYNGKTTLQEITEGIVPHQILADGVHYTTETKIVIGNMLYKKCCELGIF